MYSSPRGVATRSGGGGGGGPKEASVTGVRGGVWSRPVDRGDRI